MRKRYGMTLVEVMVSMILIFLFISGVMALIYQCTETSHTVYYLYTATNLAKNRIEWVRELRRNKGYTSLSDLPELQIDMIDAYGSSGDAYERTTQVQYTANQTQITVSVEYKKKHTKTPLKIELVTLLFQY